MVSMTGSVLNWVRWVSQHRPYFSWNDLKTEFVKRFMGIDAANRFEHLSSLKQTETVDEFVNDLIACASHTEGLGNDQMLGYFLAGLMPEIRVELQTFEAAELMCAMDGARRVERKLDFEKGKGHNFWRRPYNASTMGRKDWAQKPWIGPTQNYHSHSGRGPKEKEDHPRPTTPPTTHGTWASSRPRYARSLSNQEYVTSPTKACATSPFTPLHRCAEQVFKLVEVEAEEIEADSGLELIQLGELGPGDGPLSRESDLQWLELPLKALGGEMSKRALKVRAKLGDRKIVALVDSGASHCFINTRIMEVEELAIESTAIFGVRLGNDNRVETRGICRALPLHFVTCKMEIDCYPFNLGCIDVILGLSWLLAMRKTLVDWEDMTIEFEDGLGQKVTIHGDPTLAVSEVSMNSLHKLGEIEYQAVVWQVEAETELWAIEKLDRQMFFWATFHRIPGPYLVDGVCRHGPEYDQQCGDVADSKVSKGGARVPWADWLLPEVYPGLRENCPAINRIAQEGQGKTPFEGVYGRPPLLLKSYLPGEFIVSAVAEEFWNRDEVLRQLKFNLERA
ncbi:LOW QUALITY PROTEIN: hypothetical protein V2J09_008856 [Rumex salicifolius]